ncbi:polyprenyl synthetase family protein [Streptomyces sp. TRM43335]|uniref:Polyprenyl synthetase family protein n=1 Tax=Streptomyces taklimakanensis TaxID=2569853 RepID=A0A6G2BJV8_9ACTN|nr:polyprenyl synthetase family protein [Streptomyces taklimakanensis]MTE22359.1 polyprenyl synthetase family protein [Streptomyces taklimakanensis]
MPDGGVRSGIPVGGPLDAGVRSALKTRVDAALRDFVEEELDALLAVDADLTPVAEQLRVATAHGKRLRAAFCYWGWRASGQSDSDAPIRAAASMEPVHAAAVVHDDLIDGSPLRHGLPTAHVALRAAVSGRTRSEAARSLAVLVGDLLMSWAGQLFATCGLPGAYLSRARPLWAVPARELIAGECLEILHTGATPDTAASLKVIRYKTAKYTVEQPLLIGGALAGAAPGVREVFTAYGLPVGKAFQLRDDLLGLFGDPDRTGKANTDDIVAHRPTAVLAETWREATPDEREDLKRLMGRRRLDEDGLERVRRIMRRTGAPDRVEHMISRRVEAADDAVGRARLPSDAARALADLAATAVFRHH